MRSTTHHLYRSRKFSPLCISNSGSSIMNGNLAPDSMSSVSGSASPVVSLSGSGVKLSLGSAGASSLSKMLSPIWSWGVVYMDICWGACAISR